ncbi:MAG TPA: hypothetical protein VFF29_07945 [Bacteroidota bacterium]|nr:hypothetical protein [Bacteroidota bacterium]
MQTIALTRYRRTGIRGKIEDVRPNGRSVVRRMSSLRCIDHIASNSL